MKFVIYLILNFFVFQSFVQAVELKRLFTTASERFQLNIERENPTILEEFVLEEQQEPHQLPPYITFNGIVVRSSNPTTAWINGAKKLHQETFSVILDKENRLAFVYLPSIEKIVKLKPGQSFNTETNEIQESINME